MKELVEAKVKLKDWTFNEISNLKETIDALSKELYSEMNFIQRFDMAKETKINDSMVGLYYSDVLQTVCMIHIKAAVAGTIKELLNTATVQFGGNNNEISERSLGGEPHQERSSDDEKDNVLEE